ncbi:hypothetical protein NHX12_020234 [Muraenolepis orangiensis]|uniref:Netrin-4 n=1 Tax=Muraenolepis orangiensis TaxID=630683 RepID=A0A9Q0ER77_9TELE|nr:hypothetical protein NHX12_020234 [Muraenolepis orangiensis]
MVLLFLASWAMLVDTVAGGLGVSLGGVGPHCENRACNPRMGNLVLGRRVLTQTACGLNATERYCSYSSAAFSGPASSGPASSGPASSGHAQSPAPPPSKCSGGLRCAKCNAALPHLAHLAAAMADSSFRHPDTWWQSAEGAESETVQLDLEAEFYVTHLILVFRSPRPAAMTLERSRDFGRTWRPLMRYAPDCAAYSGAYPCTRGEVIYRALPPWKSLDPFGVEARDQLTVTNIRVRLLKPKATAPAPGGAAEDKGPPPGRHFAIYDLIVKGSCLCNGHAQHCQPAPGYRPARDRSTHVVHGRCVCRHNTAGDHCERCAPLYNDRPWQPADECQCHGHAHSCHFDWAAWRESGQRSGGVCDCLHDTEGRWCQSCREGFYRDPLRPHGAPDSCKACGCHPMGSLPFQLAVSHAPCDPSNGNCICKPGVGGAQCDSSDLYNLEGNSSESARIFRTEELFSALHYSEKCECKEQPLTSAKLFCAMNYAYVLKVKVLAAHDKGSHAEVEVKVQKVLRQSAKARLEHGRVTLFPESWTARGCTCPILNPGAEYLVAGHTEGKQGRLMVNMKSMVKPWKASLGRKVLTLLQKDCNW